MSKVSLIKSSTGSVSIKGDLNSFNIIGGEYFYPCATATDPTSTTWRNNYAPTRYSFVPNVGIYTRGPIRNMTSMFEGNTSFNEDISGWDTSHVLSMKRMFFGATSFNQDLKMLKVKQIGEVPTDFATNASSWTLPQPSWGIEANYFYAATVDVQTNFKGSFFSTNFGSNYYVHPNVGIVTTDKLTNMYDILHINTRFTFNDASIGQWDTSSVTTFEETFVNARSFNQDISGWDTSSATTMRRMFYDARAFNQDISGWDTSSVTSMEWMFRNGSYDPAVNYAFNQDIGSWDTSNVTNMDRLFENAVNFNQDLTEWDVSLIPSEPTMFSYRSPLTADNKPIWGTAGWDGVYRTYSMVGEATDPTNATWRGVYAPSGYEFIPNVGFRSKSDLTRMDFMFKNNATFNADISSWDVSNVTNMREAFNGCDMFDQDITGWDTSKVTSMYFMFRSADAFQQDIGSWDVSNVTNFGSMFQAMPFNSDITGWDVSSGTNFSAMFWGNDAFDRDISGWDVSSATNMSEMFEGAVVFNQNIGSWNVSNVTNMYQMFRNAISFDQDLSDWDVSSIPSEPVQFSYLAPLLAEHKPAWGWDGVYRTYSMVGEATDPTNATWRGEYAPSGYEFIPNVGIRSKGDITSMKSMFMNSTTFNADISSWDVSTVTDMENMFNNASAFNQDISGWDVSNVTNMGAMFRQATSFNQNIGGWDVSNSTAMYHMFNEASAFNNGGSNSINNWVFNSGVTTLIGMFMNASSFNQPVNSWDTSNVTNMNVTFYGTTAFDQNVGSWNVSNVTNFGSMFNQATSFNNGGISTTLNGIGVWNTSSGTNFEFMFWQASSFNQDLSGWNVSNSTNNTSFDGGTSSWTLPKPSF